MEKVIGIFSGKNLNMLKEEGGSGFWKVKSSRINEAKYIIIMRNHRESWAIKDDGKKHGQAFLLGKISNCESSTRYPDRKLIRISEYIELPDTDNFQDAWTKLTDGQRYPVSYLNTEDLLTKLNLDVNNLNWITFPKCEIQKEPQIENSFEDEEKDLSQVINEAKEKISKFAGVSVDRIDIQIRF